MFSNRKFKSGVDYYHKLNLSFNLMIAVPLVPFALLYLGRLKGEFNWIKFPPNWNMVIDFLIVTSVVILIYYAYRNSTRIGEQIDSNKKLRDKMIFFNDYFIKAYVLMMAGGVITTVGYLMTSSKIHIVIFVLILVFYSLKRPSLKMIVEELGLKEEESEILRSRTDIE